MGLCSGLHQAQPSSDQEQGTQTSHALPHTPANNVESPSIAATSKTFPTSPSTGVWKHSVLEHGQEKGQRSMGHIPFLLPSPSFSFLSPRFLFTTVYILSRSSHTCTWLLAHRPTLRMSEISTYPKLSHPFRHS